MLNRRSESAETIGAFKKHSRNTGHGNYCKTWENYQDATPMERIFIAFVFKFRHGFN